MPGRMRGRHSGVGCGRLAKNCANGRTK
jgi:hypothetical protein